MAREIDLTQPLSEEEMQYLIDRERWDDIKQNAEATAQDSEEAAERLSVVADHQANGTPQAASARLGDQTVTQVPDGSNPAPASLGTRQRIGGALQIQVESDDRPYEDWGKDDLKDQAGRRGLSRRGNKQELSDALRAWDEENLDEDGNVTAEVEPLGEPSPDNPETAYTGVLADDGDPDEDGDGEPDEDEEESDEDDDSDDGDKSNEGDDSDE